MLALRLSLIMENRRRDGLQQPTVLCEGELLELSDETDQKNPNFRYVY